MCARIFFLTCIITGIITPKWSLPSSEKGRGIRLVGDSLEEFDDGDLILLGSNLPHMWRNDPAYFEKDSTLHIEAIAIHFMENFWGTCFHDLPEMKHIRDLFDRAQQGIRIKGKTRDLVQQKMEKILLVNGVKRIEYLLNLLELIASSTTCDILSSSGFTKTYNLNQYR